MVLKVLLIASILGSAIAYIPQTKDQFFTDSLLREVVERLGKDLREEDDFYLDLPEINRLISDRQNEDQEDRYPLDYDSLESSNSNPSIRDQEFLQHSSLWGHHYIAGGTSQGAKMTKEIKTDATLPAYCNPPNPCPAGESSSTAAAPCIDRFENTASFSRDYQAAQDCMCDAEHMFTCPSRSAGEARANRIVDSDFDRIIQQFQVDQHKNLVAKKFHVKKNTNPFLEGEKLPVAAKKGINVNY